MQIMHPQSCESASASTNSIWHIVLWNHQFQFTLSSNQRTWDGTMRSVGVRLRVLSFTHNHIFTIVSRCGNFLPLVAINHLLCTPNICSSFHVDVFTHGFSFELSIACLSVPFCGASFFFTQSHKIIFIRYL